MRIITFICLTCLGFPIARAEDKPVGNGFVMEIGSVTCQVETYQAASPIVLEPMVNKDLLPKSQLMIAIMLTHSDISSYMSDEDIFGPSGVKGDPVKADEHRSVMKKMYEATGPSAAESPWKGMKYLLDDAFVVNSEKGRFLVYRLSTQGGKGITGKLTSSVREINGKWWIGGEKGEEGQKFQKSLLELIPAEFTRRQESASIKPLPLENLLN